MDTFHSLNPSAFCVILPAVLVPSLPLFRPLSVHYSLSLPQLVVSLLFLCTAFLIGTVSVLVLLFKVNTKRKQPLSDHESSIHYQLCRSSTGHPTAALQSDVLPTPTDVGEQEERRSQQQDSCSSPDHH